MEISEIKKDVKNAFKQIVYLLLCAFLGFISFFLSFIVIFSLAKHIVSTPDNWMIYVPVTFAIGFLFNRMSQYKQHILNNSEIEIPGEEVFAIVAVPTQDSGLKSSIIFNVFTGIQISIVSSFMYIVLTNLFSNTYFVITLILGSVMDSIINFYYGKGKIRMYYLFSIATLLVFMVFMFKPKSAFDINFIGLVLWIINAFGAFVMQKEQVKKSQASL